MVNLDNFAKIPFWKVRKENTENKRILKIKKIFFKSSKSFCLIAFTRALYMKVDQIYL